MDSSYINRRKSYDLPTPETGLAEWTSKIKALQREVDADEEVEQRRLEEEISAARQARLRRSRGPGSASRVDSLDTGAKDSDSDAPKSVAERAIEQETALRKLMGRNEIYNPDMYASSTSSDKTDPPSLASFIGGRATGPRLNKHAPQVDAHDPSQFVQPNITTPHPVFGRGGVAMPGMTDKKDTAKVASTDTFERYRPVSSSNVPLKSSPSTISNQYDKNSIQSQGAAVTVPQDSLRRRSFTVPKEPPTSLPTKNTEKVDRSAYASDELLQRNRTSSTYGTRPLSFSSTSKKEEPTSRTTSPSVTTSVYPTNTTSTPKAQSNYAGISAKTSGNSNAPVPKKVTETTPNLRRIMQNNQVYNPDKVEDAPRKTISQRAQGVSLAGFIGGSGTGPRLNRPAPQVDAHDPTQYIQPDLSTPHPIFGKGGIAMPGMVTRKTDPGDEPSERYRPVSSSKPTWPPVVPSYTNKAPDRPVSPQKTGGRERTTSVPSRANFGTNPEHDNTRTPPAASYNRSRTSSPTKDLRPTPPARERAISGPSPPPNSSNVTLPSLARPIQPQPRFPTQTPQIIPAGVAPSPAFQKPAASKDVTPSISRLQGRGFVSSMVKVSSQFEAPASPSPVQSRPTSTTGKKGSVLDRWQPNVNSQSSSPNKSTSFPEPIKRSTTRESTGAHSYSPRTPGSNYFTNDSDKDRSLKSVASLPSMAKSSSTPNSQATIPEVMPTSDPYNRSRTPGLGSATTMVLIKPSKSSADLTQIPHVDELGVKHDSSPADRTQFRRPGENEPSSKKPLIHPTRDRAKKPRKTNNTQYEAPHDSPQFPVEDPPPVNEVYIANDKPRDPKTNIKQDLPKQPDISVDNNLSTEINHHHLDSTSENSVHPISLVSQSLGNSVDTNLSRPILSPTSPVVHHSRIPSTGSRPTVMQVAQLLGEAQISTPTQELPSATNIDKAADGNVYTPEPTTPRTRANFTQMQAEKRKSSYEKYSAIILPPLKEEATPVSTPASTLNRAGGAVLESFSSISSIATIHRDQIKPVENVPIKSSVKDKFVPDDLGNPEGHAYDINQFLQTHSSPNEITNDEHTISVDILTITGATASPITGANDVFYDTEVLAIIHRSKSKSSGLASTAIWCWLGSRGTLGDREGRKLEDLAKRYSTTYRIAHQKSEPIELIRLLGGTLAIRQGTRTRWSPENTTMHLVRSLKGVILIDEHDLNVKNLCSAYSYCFTILGSIYVWHGRGSTRAERTAAMQYCKKLTHDEAPPTELVEGETDDDEMFWMILGDDDYAKADYWRWRANASIDTPYIWKVDVRDAYHPMAPIEHISMEQDIKSSIYIIDGIWELFIVVGKDARGNAEAIKVAVEVAKRLSTEVASSRPYTPTVHTLALPSQIPLDLRLSVRDMDEAWLNEGEVPDHMNLLPCSEVLTWLENNAWDDLEIWRSALA